MKVLLRFAKREFSLKLGKFIKTITQNSPHMKFMYKDFCNINKTENKFDFCVYSRLHHNFIHAQKTEDSQQQRQAFGSKQLALDCWLSYMEFLTIPLLLQLFTTSYAYEYEQRTILRSIGNCMVTYFCPLHARKISSTCNTVMSICNLFMSTCNITMLKSNIILTIC